MLASNIPHYFQIPFASSAGGAYVRDVPQASQVGISPGAASLTDGFPPLNFLAPIAGGIPPSGKDMNGILRQITDCLRWLQSGGLPKYDGTYATGIGGYPNGAVLQSADGKSFWRCTADNNTTDPDAGGANWVPNQGYGVAAITGLTSTNHTLTATEYSKGIITLAGSLTANVQIIFPALAGQWVVWNKTTGGYTVTCKTASGSSLVPVAQGKMGDLICDGSEVYEPLASRINDTRTWQNVTSSRTEGVTYTNGTGFPVFVSITAFNNSDSFLDATLTVDGLAIAKNSVDSQAAIAPRLQTTAVIPAGSTYSYNDTQTNTLTWFELR